MKHRLLQLAYILIAACGLSMTAQTKRALVIGLGEQLDHSWLKINGDRDVKLVSDMLRSNDFTDIITLVNSKATKKEIVKGFSRLTSRSQKGDIVYIHFSGHGQKMTDVNGDETDDPWDEALIPYDAFRAYGLNDKGEKHLVDDELYEMLTALSGKVGHDGAVIVAIDACHSGDATRGPVDRLPAVRGVRDRFVIPKPNIDPPHAREEWDDAPWLTLSACRDYQLNVETPDGYGSLTYALTELWNSFDKDIDNDLLTKALAARIRKNGAAIEMPQTPEMKGDKALKFSIIFKPLSR